MTGGATSPMAVATGVAGAAANTATGAATRAGGAGLGWQMLYFLALAILLIAAAYFAVRRLGRGMAPSGLGRRMAIRETLGLGPRSGLCLVEVDGHRLLIGFAPAGLSLICDLTTPAPSLAGAAALQATPVAPAMPVMPAVPVIPVAPTPVGLPAATRALRRGLQVGWAQLARAVKTAGGWLRAKLPVASGTAGARLKEGQDWLASAAGHTAGQFRAWLGSASESINHWLRAQRPRSSGHWRTVEMAKVEEAIRALEGATGNGGRQTAGGPRSGGGVR